ncbi:hypothetical protein ACH495_09030 [Micromonospora sp. NPDC018662]|uniref:hypothetical protein n=1 Tax=Micromonospora sp. NPDC018662 TaxID=3364238 RepID=UPI0037AB0991
MRDGTRQVQEIRQGRRRVRLLLVGVIVFFTLVSILVGLLLRDARRAEAFLRAHPADPATEPL